MKETGFQESDNIKIWEININLDSNVEDLNNFDNFDKIELKKYRARFIDHEEWEVIEFQAKDDKEEMIRLDLDSENSEAVTKEEIVEVEYDISQLWDLVEELNNHYWEELYLEELLDSEGNQIAWND